MGKRLISGVRAAIGIPRDPAGNLDEAALRKCLCYLMDRGIPGFVINGATGEYCLTTPKELAHILAITDDVTEGRADFLCGIGAAGIQGCLESARLAAASQAKALLLPMPHFFSYDPCDLEIFCRTVAENVDLPVMLYNLPFTAPLPPETVHHLIQACPNIIGIKDSIGTVEILRSLTRARVDTCRIVGSDGILVEALREGYCDGVISGVASVLPGLILSLYRHAGDPESAGFRQGARALAEFLVALGPFPVPWGLKWIGEFAGIIPASFSQPVSAQRRAQAEQLKRWFFAWQETSGEEVPIAAQYEVPGCDREGASA